jgi:Spy/CpxP family protein refolding chaperone
MTRRICPSVLATVLTLALALPATVIGQTTSTDVSKKTGEAWDAVKSYTMDKKNEAVAQGKQLVKETDDKIKQLEGKASKASGEAKVQYDKEIKDLKAKRAQAARKLDEMSKASAASWDSAKQGFADAYKDLHQSYDKAAARLK